MAGEVGVSSLQTSPALKEDFSETHLLWCHTKSTRYHSSAKSSFVALTSDVLNQPTVVSPSCSQQIQDLEQDTALLAVAFIGL